MQITSQSNSLEVRSDIRWQKQLYNTYQAYTTLQVYYNDTANHNNMCCIIHRESTCPISPLGSASLLVSSSWNVSTVHEHSQAVHDEATNSFFPQVFQIFYSITWWQIVSNWANLWIVLRQDMISNGTKRFIWNVNQQVNCTGGTPWNFARVDTTFFKSLGICMTQHDPQRSSGIIVSQRLLKA